MSAIPVLQLAPRRRQGWHRYLNLILYKTYAELKAESERTYVGYAWWVIDPLLSMAVYWVVFEWILRRGTDDYASFLIVGLVPWRWLSTGIVHGASSILASRSLMQQVYLPKLILPVVSVLTDTVKFLVVLALLLLYIVLAGYAPGWQYLALPAVVLVQGAFIGALSLILAGITPFAPDLRMVLENLVRLWLFLSGVFYPLDVLPETLRFAFRFNPMATIIDSYRNVLMYGRWPDLVPLLLIAVLSVVLGAVGARIIRRNDFLYPKLLG